MSDCVIENQMKRKRPLNASLLLVLFVGGQ